MGRDTPVPSPLTVRTFLIATVMLVTAVSAGYTLSHGPRWLGVACAALALIALGGLLWVVNRKLRGDVR